MFADPQVPESRYRVTVTRAGDRLDIWTFQMQDSLPTIPIPLLAPDPVVSLNLSQAIQQVYEEADYDLTLDYSKQPPPPMLSDRDQQWLRAILN